MSVSGKPAYRQPGIAIFFQFEMKTIAGAGYTDKYLAIKKLEEAIVPLSK